MTDPDADPGLTETPRDPDGDNGIEELPAGAPDDHPDDLTVPADE